MKKFLHHDPAEASYLRNFVFGVEDSLVSTVGLLSGLAIAEIEMRTIFLTGVILIFVEAFSMAVGSFLSEYSAEEYLNEKKPFRRSLIDGIVMFVSYLVSGLIPLSPYIFFQEPSSAFTYSIIFSLATLTLLGIGSAKISKQNILKSAFRMLAVGGLAILAGILIGQLAGRL
ncbi:VIT1/CCC1 transporter family protein [bacterium]|nr:VIT1/CCC1 transporter family protein [bacterium]